MLRTKATATASETQRERDHREIAYRAALEGIVLLENDGSLPLIPGKIALYGAGARRTVKGGSGSGEVHERHSVTLEEGLEAAGFTVTTKSWIDDYDRLFTEGEVAFAAVAAKHARRLSFKALGDIMANPYRYPTGRTITDQDITTSDTDTCIYVISRQAGEGGDRRLEAHDYSLSPMERANLEICARAYATTVVVINVGSSFEATFMDEIEGLNSLVYVCQLGSCGGSAIAAVLVGQSSPSGKLTDSWARNYDDIPYGQEFGHLNGDLVDENYREGIYVGYRYFDTFSVAPKYPFGYGLSYTDFRVTNQTLEVEGTRASLEVTVHNVGHHPGREIVQVYVSCPQVGLPKAYQQLAGFAKTGDLAPGEEQRLTIDIDLVLLASYDEETARYLLDAGEYVVRVGRSSRDTMPVALLLFEEQVVVSTHSNICSPHKPLQELPAPSTYSHEELPDLPRVPVLAAAFSTLAHTYSAPPVYGDPQVDALMNKLSLDDMITLVSGAGMLSVMVGGGTYFTAPGVSGYTTSKLVDKGITNVALSDGPAGLRLQRRSVVNKRGKIKMVDAQMDILNYLPRYITRFLMGDPAEGELRHQFTTAFPVENALAQTWNTALLEEVGGAVGREMAEYGVTYWLAPGVNLHRNPLAGRNFEYYSEDPFLSGKLAAAVIRGLEGNDGCYATLKHLVANEREEKRSSSSSNVSERALRELYLRPFQIAIQDAAPKAVMTSYNMVNGRYTANSHDLCTKVLRNEWGFEGLVMTDWLSTAKPYGDSAQCMTAGNDLIMPGGGGYRKTVRKGLQTGRFAEQDLRRCAANVLRGVVHSRLAKEIQL